LNNELDRVRTVSTTCLNTYRSEHMRNPTPAELKDLIQLKLGNKEKVVKDISLTTYIENKCLYFESLPITSREKRSVDTIKAYRNLGNLIEKYEKKKEHKLTFDNLDETKYWDFLRC